MRTTSLIQSAQSTPKRKKRRINETTNEESQSAFTTPNRNRKKRRLDSNASPINYNPISQTSSMQNSLPHYLLSSNASPRMIIPESMERIGPQIINNTNMRKRKPSRKKILTRRSTKPRKAHQIPMIGKKVTKRKERDRERQKDKFLRNSKNNVSVYIPQEMQQKRMKAIKTTQRNRRNIKKLTKSNKK